MGGQQREDITLSAQVRPSSRALVVVVVYWEAPSTVYWLPPLPQFALRLLAFRQIHKVLGMDPLPQMNPRFNVRNSRKRRRDNSDGNDSFEGEGKKDKKDYDSF